jgi:hypothetical protein
MNRQEHDQVSVETNPVRRPPSQHPGQPGRESESSHTIMSKRENPAIVRRRQLVAEAIRADPARSDRGIALDMGVSRDLVTRIRRKLAAEGETVLGLPVRGRDGLTYQFKTRYRSRIAELDRLYRRLYPVVRVVESEEFARTYRAGSETQRRVLRRIVERLRKRLGGLESSI